MRSAHQNWMLLLLFVLLISAVFAKITRDKVVAIATIPTHQPFAVLLPPTPTCNKFSLDVLGPDLPITSMYIVQHNVQMCLVVAFVATSVVNEFSNQLLLPDVGLVSVNSLVAPRYQQCASIVNNTVFKYACSYVVKFTEPGLYNVSLRGDYFTVPDMTHSVQALSHLGAVMGNHRELRSPHLQRIFVRGKHHKVDEVPAPKPSCTFASEMKLWKGHGNPQWKKTTDMTSQDEFELRSLWYNDSYIWGNDLCHYKPYSGEQILDAMDKQNISKILMVGDSLTRFMWGDFEDLFSNCTQDWLLRNPIVFLDEKLKNGQTASAKTSWDNALSSAGGFGAYFNKTGQCFHQSGIVPIPDCCRTNSCPNRRGEVIIHRFLPGYMNPGQPELIMPSTKRSVQEWETVFQMFLEDEKPRLPNVVVFNAGLWLVNAYRTDAPNELEKIVTAWFNLCRRNNILFVWRSTYYHHRALNMNLLIRRCNLAAVTLLVEKFDHPYFIDSTFQMSMLRPDCTVDGFHYNYRMLRSSWHRCTDQDFSKLDADCVRDMSWPMSVAKASTLALVNLLFNR
jgi:hypothetical protein